MIHECEPKLEELKKIQKELFIADSTDENMKKIKAIESQIKRHQPDKEDKEEVR